MPVHAHTKIRIKPFTIDQFPIRNDTLDVSNNHGGLDHHRKAIKVYEFPFICSFHFAVNLELSFLNTYVEIPRKLLMFDQSLIL